MKEVYTVSLTSKVNDKFLSHLIRSDLQEDLCFGLYLPSNGSSRKTAIIQEVILPLEDDRNVHGNASFNAQYLSRVLSIARLKQMGVVFLHSHPAFGWQDMSEPDIAAETKLAISAFAVTDLPLIGMTAGLDGAWSARFWMKDLNQKKLYHRKWCKSVKVIGEGLDFTFNSSQCESHINSEFQQRTISAWGLENQHLLSRIQIGIVGVGSVGSQVAESLARSGFANVKFIDFDTVEKKNLDRLTNVFKDSIGKAKVLALKEAFVRSSTATNLNVTISEYSICEEAGYRAALDCDIIFSCVDRPWARQVLNYIAYCHLIPVIDGGIKVRTNSKNTKMMSADWKAQTVGFGKPCLECLGQYKTDLASLELEGYLDDSSYIEGFKGEDSLPSGENVFAFSTNLASLQVLQLISLVLKPSGVAYSGQQLHHMVIGKTETNKKCECDKNCFFTNNVGKADYTGVIPYGIHSVAEAERRKRVNSESRTFKQKVFELLKRMFS